MYMYKAPLPISWEIQFSFILLYKTFNLALASPTKFPFPSEEKIHVHVHCSNGYVLHYLGGGEREQHTCN